MWRSVSQYQEDPSLIHKPGRSKYCVGEEIFSSEYKPRIILSLISSVVVVIIIVVVVVVFATDAAVCFFEGKGTFSISANLCFFSFLVNRKWPLDPCGQIKNKKNTLSLCKYVLVIGSLAPCYATLKNYSRELAVNSCDVYKQSVSAKRIFGSWFGFSGTCQWKILCFESSCPENLVTNICTKRTITC